jgi:hypothetical protein
VQLDEAGIDGVQGRTVLGGRDAGCDHVRAVWRINDESRNEKMREWLTLSVFDIKAGLHLQVTFTGREIGGCIGI